MMGVSLYTSRVILNALGVEDYGIYSVVGGVVALFSFINSAMSTATQRYLAVDVGKNDLNGLKKTFNSSLIIHFLIALMILILAETIGLWFVDTQMNIAENRMEAVHFIYQFSIFTSILTITQVPFNALIIVRERMNVFAVISLLEVVLKLLIVYLLFISPYDKLKTYSILVFAVSLLVTSIYKLYCLKNFEESKFAYYNDLPYYKKLISYSGWNLFGNIALVARGQGTNMLLNIFFGTVVNASYGIMLQVQNAVSAFVSNFQTAVNPQIYKSYANREFLETEELMYFSAKFSYFIMLLMVLPIAYNIDFILELWLANPPPYASTFIVLMLINLLIETISRPLITGALATGNIKSYQLVIGTILFANLPINYVVFKKWENPELFLYVAILISLVALGFRLYFLRKLLNVRLVNFFKKVAIPTILVTLLLSFVVTIFDAVIGRADQFFGFAIISFSLMVIMGLIVLTIGLNQREKEKVYSFVVKKVRK